MTSFNYPTVFRLMSTNNMPAFVKNASVEELNVDEEKLPDHLFADDKFRLYPCHTKVATALSAALFREDFDKYSEERQKYIMKNLLSHARSLKIASEVEGILRYKPTESEKFALELRTPSGEIRKLFPIRNEREVKAAANYIHEHWRDIPAELRAEVATNILKEAEEKHYCLGNLRSRLEKSAGLGLVDKNLLSKVLLNRIPFLMKRSSAGYEVIHDELLFKLASAIDNTPASDQHKLKHLVWAVSDLFVECPGINQPIEYDVVVSKSEIESANKDYVLLKNGSCYNIHDLELTPEDINDGLERVLEGVVLDGSVVSKALLKKKLASLSETESNWVCELFTEKGIKPVFTVEKELKIPV